VFLSSSSQLASIVGMSFLKSLPAVSGWIMENEAATDPSVPRAFFATLLVTRGEVDHDRIDRNCKPMRSSGPADVVIGVDDRREPFDITASYASGQAGSLRYRAIKRRHPDGCLGHLCLSIQSADSRPARV
jgi:hypothetical protein